MRRRDSGSLGLDRSKNNEPCLGFCRLVGNLGKLENHFLYDSLRKSSDVS